jgi:PKD repeat protein
VVLTVTDDDGATDEETQDVTVVANQPPVATFTFSCTGLTCSFNASGSSDPDGTIASYSWNFGHGSPGAGQTTSHTYAEPGTYSVGLTVTDDDGASDTDQQNVSVSEPATMHVGDLDGVRISVKNTWTARVTVAVHDADHNPVEGAEVTGTWSEGATGPGECWTNATGQCEISFLEIPKKTSSVVFTVYAIDGMQEGAPTYQANDNHDPDGDSNGTTIIVPPPANQPPVATFTYGCTDLVCTFDSSGSYDPDGSIVSYAWDFGDGSTSSGPTAEKTYPAAATYTVRVTVTDDGGATGSDTQSVPVGGATPGTMYVLDIQLTGKAAGPNRSATAVVTIEDTDGNRVEGATIYVTWSGDYSAAVTGVTLADGTVTFTSDRVRQANAEFTFTVDDVVKSGFTYDPGLNLDTSVTIYVQ